MLRTNLSTRPFYNDRAVRTVLGVFALIAIALTLFNIYEILRLQGQSRDARQTIAQNDAQARELRDKAQDIRRAIDRVKLDAVQAAAREANALIDRRTFSWTELLNYFQSTLPPPAHRGRDAAGRQRRPTAGADFGVLAARRGSRRVHGRARTDRRILGCAAARGNGR
jgi:hypothetical protein